MVQKKTLWKGMIKMSKVKETTIGQISVEVNDPYDSVGVQPLTTEEAVDIAMMAPFRCNTGEKAENEEEE